LIFNDAADRTDTLSSLEDMAKSAYIHIPFCAHKCDFCDFAAFAGVDELSLEYCRTVAKEIHDRLNSRPNDTKLESVFYGGGTPGYIDPQQLRLVHEALIESAGVAPDAEITLETTPQTITADKARAWKEIGINRISVGVQSFSDAELKAMGRDHTSTEALRGIEAAKSAGFENVALDLMYGLPEQTVQSWQSTLQTALSLKLPHMSAYGLTIAGNSPLLLRYPKESAAYPNEDAFVSMYEMLIDSCEQAGLSQYEVSNFARPGYQSAHNITYWMNDEYLAFGVSAHRYVGGVRSSNYRSLKRYMREYLGDETHEIIDKKTRISEAIFLGLRMRKGLDLQLFERRYGCDLLDIAADKIQKLTEGGFLQHEAGHLRLSQKGVLVSNLVLAELM
jgi:oxygen-independent coproporphyrinogen-3 oxidase